jgi:hypothetical protein
MADTTAALRSKPAAESAGCDATQAWKGTAQKTEDT